MEILFDKYKIPKMTDEEVACTTIDNYILVEDGSGHIIVMTDVFDTNFDIMLEYIQAAGISYRAVI